MASNDRSILTAVKTWAKDIFQPKGDYLEEIPPATDEAIGGVKPDGETTTVDENGVISCIGGGDVVDVPIATTEEAGIVKPDGESIIVEKDGTIRTTVQSVKGDPGKSAYEIAKDNGFDGTESEWLDSLRGKDGIAPTIGENNHWFVGDKDTGVLAVGKEGKSISSISKDENNNIIVTFSDGSTQNLGELAIDVSADFLTSGGFGNLRYYNGKFQKYDSTKQEWVDTAATPDNVIVINMIPGPMKKMIGAYDHTIGHYKIKLEMPDDTVVDGQVVCVVDKVIIRRKMGAVPENENDGDLLLEIPRADFGQYNKFWFVDEKITPALGETYCYKAFPVSTTGFVNSATVNEVEIIAKAYTLYGFKIDQNESDPASMITYIEDNKGYSFAHMNYDSDRFDYGDWQDAFFMKVRPCMLKYDGTVDYFLDPNNYGLKEDGTPSDVANEDYGGNAMVQFPKVYWKIVDNGDDTANVYISDRKVDEDFACWSHIDNNGNEIDYCYMPIYNGSNVDNVLRSLSDKTISAGLTTEMEVEYAKANNQTDDIIWYTEVYSDRTLVNLLLLLIGKSTDTQTVFGNGNYFSTITLTPGDMNTKGLFWGSNAVHLGVKVFGMENWWGNQWRRIAGLMSGGGATLVKMTYGQSDGSTVDGYNFDGSGYIEILDSVFSGVFVGYINKMLFTSQGLIPRYVSGSDSTYYADGIWFNGTQYNYALVCGSPSYGAPIGAFIVYLQASYLGAYPDSGASISCKPLSQGGTE